MDPKQLFKFRLMAPAKDGDAGGGDRGDDFEPDDEGEIEDVKVKAKDDTVKASAADDTVVGGGKDDAEDEPDDEGEEGGDDAKKKTGGLPWARHKALMAKEREQRAELEKKLAQYQGGDRIAVINEEIKTAEDKIVALDAEYSKLITDGQHEQAAAKMKEIRKLERETSDKRTNMAAQASESRAVERVRYDTTVERLEAAYPVINPDNDDYDKDTAQDVMDLAETYNKRGMTPAEAIQKAAKKLLGTETKKQETAVDTKARVSDEDKAKALADERKADQVKKNLAAKEKTPASTKRIGADSDKAGGGIDGKSVMQMKFDDFVKLDEETLARMRGDVIA